MCCGRKRQAFRNTPTLSRTPETMSMVPDGIPRQPAPDTSAPPPPPSADTQVARGPSAAMLLRYLGPSAIRVLGPVTGRRYEFAGDQSDQRVDRRDAAVMLRHGSFARA